MGEIVIALPSPHPLRREMPLPYGKCKQSRVNIIFPAIYEYLPSLNRTFTQRCLALLNKNREKENIFCSVKLAGGTETP